MAIKLKEVGGAIGALLKKDFRALLDKRTNVLYLDEETIKVNLPENLQQHSKELYRRLDNYYRKHAPNLRDLKRSDVDLKKRGTIFRLDVKKGFLLVQKGAKNNFRVLRVSLTGALTAVQADKLIGTGPGNKNPLQLGHVAGYGLEQYNTPLGYKLFNVAAKITGSKSGLTDTSAFSSLLEDLTGGHAEYNYTIKKNIGTNVNTLKNLGFGSFILIIPQWWEINANLSKLESSIFDRLSNTIVDVESSKSFMQMVYDTLVEAFLTGKHKPYSSIGKTSGSFDLKSNTQSGFIVPTTENYKTGRLDAIRLQTLINLRLHDQIRKNMGKGRSRQVLNYRTGRFAKSAEATAVLQSREKYLDVFYTYQRYPYDTFLPGGRLYKPGRDPRTIIGRSIRQLAVEFVSNNFKVNPILREG